MQNAWSLLNYLGALAGNFTIISGIDINNGNATNGFVYINGEVLNFVGGAVSTDVIINETITSLEFEDGNENPVVYIRYATFGIGATSFPWTNFKRPKTTIELTEKTQAIQTKLDDIQDGAEVNVQADWNETDNTKKSYIKHKPTITDPFLLKGTYPIGDPMGGDDSKTVTFSSVGTSNYMVLGSLVSKGTLIFDNDIHYLIRDKTPTSFKIILADTGYPSQVQDLDFDYALLKL
ncbi:hypothetical protein [Flavobacterium psychrophilum]|uniref:hypothetical protein n=1 Tax=Flavobacterium psychrophilum TaxID=96345 RepID=UPI00117A0CD2|nr:hypothetical protein [Flavobacterium psychrophilum]MBF2024845.1 hypothetical protein [Flavobacterium psychrophilum]MCB5983166.1 hypothetical protein [Flavobacterium psychrophilum]MCB5995483.1 hypothetical protein [Flavobacterium psychrophilum]MCB5997750.1 hypothetical protein [Flavobacterium psychrophilum]MCB6005384.1 hypothetical protein [Flavobacterium psychrophilum]